MNRFLLFLLVCLSAKADILATSMVMYGCSFRTIISNSTQFDGGSWNTNTVPTQTTLSPSQPRIDLSFTEAMVSKGAYCYVFVLQSQVSGGFANGSFKLNPSDFAGQKEGFFKIDASGFPCLLIVGAGNRTWREYRLLNPPFAPITLTLTP